MASGMVGSSLKHLRDLFGGGTAVGLGDGELLRRYAASHDGPAFAALVARHGPMVAATCRAVLRDHHDVEDAFQATFLVLARKAGSLRNGDTLGGWLHRVAYRAAVQRNIEVKRRRRHESESPAMDVPDTGRAGLDFDLSAILHEEIDRLPESHRVPVVLCDLEGLTYEQAAARLHSTAPTLYHRLAKGRKRLRDRLVRRGVTAAVAGVALELSRASASAAVPSAWALAAVAAATGGPIPTTVAALGHQLIRSLLMTRLKIATAAILAMAALASAGVVAAGARRPDAPEPPPAAPAVAPVADEPKPEARPATPTATLTVEARDLLTDAPVPGIRLEFSLGHGSKKVQAATDGSGLAQFSHPADVRYFFVSASREGFVSQAIRWDYDANAPAAPDRLLFQMEKATTVGGRVVDQDGKPMAGATVVIDVSKRYPKSRQWVDFKYESAQTDATGRWSFPGVPEKPDSVKIGVHHPLCLQDRTFIAMEDFKPLTALRDGSATLHLRRGTLIEGRVLSADGRPVAAAQVYYGAGRRYPNSIPPFKTDAEGRFTIGVEPGTLTTLTAQATGYGPALLPIRVGPVPSRVQLTLPPSRVLRGRVVDPAGKPIARAGLSIAWSGSESTKAARRGDEALAHELTTDADGRFAWADAPDSGITASVWADGFAAKDKLTLAPDVDHRIVLIPPTRIKGTVVDGLSGQPISHFSLTCGTVWNPGERLIWQSRDGIDKESKKAAGSFEYTIEQPTHQCVVRVSADGYLSEDSGRFSPDGNPRSFTFRLTRAEPIRGTVLNPDGSSAVDGFVYLVPAEEEDTIDYLDIQNGDVSSYERTRSIHAKIGADGRFSLPPQTGDFAIVALSDAGSAIVRRRDLRGDRLMRLRPWARVSGTVMLDGKPAANLGLSSFDPDEPRRIPGEPRIENRSYVETAADGRFELRRVMPGRLVLGRTVPNGVAKRIWLVAMATVDVESGKTYELKIGRSGRRITGRLQVPDSGVWMVRKAEIVAKSSGARRPAPIGFHISDDGRFRAQDLPPGDHILWIALHEPPPDDACGWGRLIAAYSREFNVTGGADDSPLDLGTLQPAEVGGRPLRVGEAAPDFAVKALDGKDLTLADFRGKFLLLDFWATWCAPCVAEIPNLDAVHKAFGADPRFAIVSLSLDETPADASTLVKSQKMAWHQGWIGPESQIATAYNATAIPATFLIGPDGRIVATDLRGEKLKAAVAEALGSRKAADRAPAR